MSDLPQITGYQILEIAGRGGMSTVYRAIQIETSREVALKLITSSNQDKLDQFSREGEIIASLEHPHILPVYDFGFSGDQPYLVMRLLEGGSLADWVRGGSRPDPEKVFEVIIQMAEALDFSHARGVLHRDVKPSNMLLDQNGFVYLSDFGIAMFPSDGESRGLGSAAYISPEQARGDALDGRSDIYSLAVTLYELLTGEKPYTGETPVAVMVKQINEPVPDPRDVNPDISPAVAELITWGMSKKPDGRPQSAGQFGQLLQYAIRNPDAPVRPSSSGPTLPIRTLTPPRGISTISGADELNEPHTPGWEDVDKNSRWLVLIFGSFLLLAALITGFLIFIISQNPDFFRVTPTSVPTIAVTQAPSTPVQTLQAGVNDNLVYSDRFDVNSSQEDLADGIGFVDGALQIQTDNQDLKLWPASLANDLTDSAMRVELLESDRANNYKVGLVCRLHQIEDETRFFGVVVDKNGGVQTATSFRFTNNELVSIDSEEISEELIIRDLGTFVLEMHCIGEDIDLFINDFRVLSSRDTEPVAGISGLVTANNGDGAHEVRFDNVKIETK